MRNWKRRDPMQADEPEVEASDDAPDDHRSYEEMVEHPVALDGDAVRGDDFHRTVDWQ